MDINLNIKQRSAILQFLNYLTSTRKWNRDQLLSIFDSYSLADHIELDYTDYVYTLRELPFRVKRDFVCKILNSWSFAANEDFYTLYQTLQDILYLKMETGVECVLFNNIINLSMYLGAKTFSFNATAETDYYMIDMYFNFPDVDFHDNQVRFTTSSEDETPRVEFSLSESLLKQKMSFIDQPSQGDISALLQILTENRTKTHCPWIYLYYSLNCTYMGSRFSQFLQIEFRNIVYVDNNG